VKFFNTC